MGHFWEFHESTRSEPVSMTGEGGRDRNADPALQALANYTWPEGAVALVASDLMDLEAREAAEVIRSLLELGRALDQDEIVILNLEYLSEDGSGHASPERVNTLRELVLKVSRGMRLCPPRLALEKRGDHRDLRIIPIYR